MPAPHQVWHIFKLVGFTLTNGSSLQKSTKNAGVQPSDEPGNCTPAFVVSEVWENEPFSLHILGYSVGWEIIRDYLQKADTEERTADFQPLFVQLLERLDKYRGQTITFA